jgi:hypothetical protein
LVELQSWLPEVSLGGNDAPGWKNNSGKYSCADTWNMLRKKETRVDWWKAVWHPAAAPHHSFMLWLVFRGALVTRERMCRWGPGDTSETLFALSAEGVWRVVSIFSSSVGSVGASGENLWRFVLRIIQLRIGRI